MSTKKVHTITAEQKEKMDKQADIKARMETGKIEIMKVVEGVQGAEKLADLIERGKKKGKLSGLKATMIGDPSVYADSFVYAFANCGIDITIVCPEDKNPPDEIVNHCNQYGDLVITNSLEDGLKGADVIFVSDDGLDYNYTVDLANINFAKPDAIILHTLPVAPDGNLDSDVLSLPNFVGVEEALHLPEIEMAILSLLIGKQK